MLKKLSRYLIYSPALMPLYSIKLVSISIILFALVSLINSDMSSLRKQTFKGVFVTIAPHTIIFLLYAVSLLWTEDINQGISYLERTLSFIIFPVVILILKPFRDTKEIDVFIKLFIFSTFLLAVLTFINIGFLINKDSDLFPNLTISLRENIENTYVVGEHPIYFSLLLATGAILLMYKRFKSNFLNVLIFGINLLGVVASGTRGVFIALLLTFIIMVIVRFGKKKKALLPVSLIIILAIATIFLSPMKKRMEQFINTKKIYPEGTYYNSFNIRMAIYKCSFDVISQKPWIGHGPGDIKKKLKECYGSFSTSAFETKYYNTHNQYLHYLSTLGISGLLIILYYFYTYLRTAYHSKNLGHLGLLLLFYFAFFTENILVRNTGIVVFSVFNCIFAYQIQLGENEKSAST